MTGYQEVLTDPSYAGQMVCMTYPLQGNYGVRDADAESGRPWARALVVRWACPSPSHHSSEASLDEYLRRWNVPGITDIDTRALTRHIRTHGTQRAVLVHETAAPSRARLDELVAAAKRVTPLAEQDLVAETSRTKQEEWLEPLPPELRTRRRSDGAGLLVAVVDYGVKTNILRSLRERGCRVVVLPHTATWADVRSSGADGLVLSNGPGDPAVLDGPVELARAALGRIPMFGICLGHQIMGRAAGATTSRLPYGHHGANHPVKDADTGRVHITSQNHEFQVDAVSIPAGDFYVSQRNLNDSSVEGLGHRRLPAFSVQYHPEGCPGPQDNQHLYDRFIDMVRSGAPVAKAVAGMKEEPRPRKVLILGSGPIVIGQAAEFDYAGTQACKALREEGIETVLVNSNPATIMTDEEVADRVYLEPLTVEAVEKVIERERRDGRRLRDERCRPGASGGARARRIADSPGPRRAIAVGLERDRVRGDAGRRGHVHHGLQHGKPRSDGRAHGRFHRRRPGADALRPRPPDAAVVSDPDHPGARHRGRLQRPVRAGPAKLALLRDRGQPACQPLVRARVQGDRLSHRASRREGRGRQAARGDPQRDHGAHVCRLRTGARLLRGQDPALAVRPVSGGRQAAGDADGVDRRGDGAGAHLRGRADQGHALARAEAAGDVGAGARDDQPAQRPAAFRPPGRAAQRRRAGFARSQQRHRSLVHRPARDHRPSGGRRLRPRPAARGLLGRDDRGAAGRDRRAGGADLQARRQLRRGVRGRDALLLLLLGGRERGGRRRRPDGGGHRLGSDPDWAGNRVRLLLGPRRLGAARGRGAGGDGELQPRNRVHRLRHLRPPVLR